MRSDLRTLILFSGEPVVGMRSNYISPMTECIL
jgi:hypothetical protein